MQIVGQKKFAAAVLNSGEEIFIVYVAYLRTTMLIYLAWKTHIALLLTKEINILDEYLDFAIMFWKKSAAKLFERFDIHNIW